jgi:hypothetical protein
MFQLSSILPVPRQSGVLQAMPQVSLYGPIKGVNGFAGMVQKISSAQKLQSLYKNYK